MRSSLVLTLIEIHYILGILFGYPYRIKNFTMSTENFSWPAYPRNEVEFEALMQAIDGHLASEGLTPFQRPLHVGRKLWEAFGWGGLMLPPKELANQPSFEGDVLMAKVHRWYENFYGDKLKGDFAYGFFPARLGNALWRVRAGVGYGRFRFFIDRNIQNQGASMGTHNIEATRNVLCEVENLPQGLANRLSEEELGRHFHLHIAIWQSLQWRAQLPRTELLSMAHHDYDESTASALGGRYGQTRWAAQQAVEKTIKGLLAIGSTTFPTGGANGHNLAHIAKLLDTHHGISLDATLLDLVACSPKVRYAEEPSTESQALAANHAVLGILEQLRESPRIEDILVRASV